MAQFAQLLIGSFFTAAVSVGSWLIGLLMGIALAKLVAVAPNKHADVEQLLARQRATAAKAGPAVAVAAPGASSQA